MGKMLEKPLRPLSRRVKTVPFIVERHNASEFLLAVGQYGAIHVYDIEHTADDKLLIKLWAEFYFGDNFVDMLRDIASKRAKI